ncbi:MAG: hypothetical protein WB952_12740 [Terriglobales bacterium]
MDESRITVRAWQVFSWISVLALLGLGIWWNFRLPSTGKGGLFLAIGAVLMPLFWEKIGVAGKMTWVAMLFVLLAVEYRAIDKDRDDFAAAEAKRQKEERQEFSKIGDAITTNVQKLLDHSDEQFKATLAEQAKHFDATMAKEQVSINEVTGGNSYAIVFPDFSPTGKNTFPLVVTVCTRCQYSIPNARVNLQTGSPPLGLPGIGSLIYYGAIDPNFTVGTSGTITPTMTGESVYTIIVFARNKPTRETLRVRFNPKRQLWECSWHIEREEKKAHFNPHTQMAEGQVNRILEDWPWKNVSATPYNPAKTTVIH